ncbi:polysaccharide pyruvyl transferase family protein [Castellaniella denitrificans]|uniref:polysaccharide pyruvyl transferase family protein n=1 Tax=Castellaniella denitrificans TaxID=56119 RepID=UPI003617C764
MKILIRSPQDPLKIYDAYESTKKIGGNSGNLLYINSVARALYAKNNKLSFGGFKAHVSNDRKSWAESINEKYDHYVMPLSNAFRSGMTEILIGFTEIVRNLDIPVTVVGIGAQATALSAKSGTYSMARTGKGDVKSPDARSDHDRVVYEFCSAVLEKSRSIGVRGAYTRDYLLSLGLPEERVRIIGCPSLFTWGPSHRIVDRDGKDYSGKRREFHPSMKISMNIDYRVPGIERMIYKNFQIYENLFSPSQDSMSARMILDNKQYYDISKVNLGAPVHKKHGMFVLGRLLYYPNPWGWIDDLSTYDFVFGTRLHGNIAGILGGTPAHLIAHDSRTIELANYHGIPYTEYDSGSDFLAEDMFRDTSYEKFNDLMEDRFNVFLDFLRENNLSTAYDEPDAGVDFDDKIAASRRIGPIYSNGMN